MKSIFYCCLISLLFLSSPSNASRTFEKEIAERTNRGLSIYESLSCTWIDTREEIANDGLVPFIDRLTDALKSNVHFTHERMATKLGDQGTTESFIAAKVKKTAPDIQRALSDIRNYNLQHYKRPNIFSSLNILDANAFFYKLGKRYQNVDDFIADLLYFHLSKSQDYKLFCKWCTGINPAVRTFFAPISQVFIHSPTNAQAYQLLWYEPYQLLPQAINKHLEELFAIAYSPAELQPISSISTHRDNAATPQ